MDSPGLAAMMVQFGPLVQTIMQRIQPLVDQPVVRMPWVLPLARSQVIAAGASGSVLTPTDFTNALEWPFEITAIKFSQDPAHTYRDWQVQLLDQIFNQPLQKSAFMVADVVDDNTGKWKLDFPWVMRPKGGAWQVVINNLDTINPITVDLGLIGSFLIPRK
jgi:hypothetical protein